MKIFSLFALLIITIAIGLVGSIAGAIIGAPLALFVVFFSWLLFPVSDPLNIAILTIYISMFLGFFVFSYVAFEYLHPRIDF